MKIEKTPKSCIKKNLTKNDSDIKYVISESQCKPRQKLTTRKL